MTIQEVCNRLGKSESTVRRWIRTGKLTAIMVDGIYNISAKAVDALSNDQSTEGGGDNWSPEVVKQLVNGLRNENEYLKERIRELESARERSDQIAMQMTRQLEQSQRLLEYHQEPWYRKIFKKGKREGDVL